MVGSGVGKGSVGCGLGWKGRVKFGLGRGGSSLGWEGEGLCPFVQVFPSRQLVRVSIVPRFKISHWPKWKGLAASKDALRHYQPRWLRVVQPCILCVCLSAGIQWDPPPHPPPLSKRGARLMFHLKVEFFLVRTAQPMVTSFPLTMFLVFGLVGDGRETRSREILVQQPEHFPFQVEISSITTKSVHRSKNKVEDGVPWASCFSSTVSLDKQ